jgi:hypothetical protein
MQFFVCIEKYWVGHLNVFLLSCLCPILCSCIHRPGQGFWLCQLPHSYRQIQQPWFLKWLPRLVHQLLLRQSSVCQIEGPVVRTWQSLWGCHRVQLSGWHFSLYTSMMTLLLLVILWSTSTDYTILYNSGTSLDTVLTNFQTSFNAIQHSFRGLQPLLNASKTKCMLFNRSLPAPACPYSGRFWLRICGHLQIPRCLVRL